ncbi:MAG: hypothetical protein JSS81_18210 [Acidobacteria bacterium]|nr:hypothetical protein [Acidobacteriota bacterium]
MQTSAVTLSGEKIQVGNCVAVLRQGVELLEKLDDGLYAKAGGPENSSVGGHFRHNLDFVTNFLDGLEKGKIDYAARERDPRVENDRACAAARFRAAIDRLENLGETVFDAKIVVRSETNPALWCDSSAARELEFLQSHTIHHYALIRFKLAAEGFQTPPEFGVAPSTLEYWKGLEDRAGEQR